MHTCKQSICVMSFPLKATGASVQIKILYVTFYMCQSLCIANGWMEGCPQGLKNYDKVMNWFILYFALLLFALNALLRLQRLLFCCTGDTNIVDVKSKSCFLAVECVEASVNYGFSKTTITPKCCNTELCNDQPAPGNCVCVCVCVCVPVDLKVLSAGRVHYCLQEKNTFTGEEKCVAVTE